jgi:hypothetical protein
MHRTLRLSFDVLNRVHDLSVKLLARLQFAVGDEGK